MCLQRSLLAPDESFQLSCGFRPEVVGITGDSRCHFCIGHEAWIAAVTAMVVQYGEASEKPRSLQTVRTFLSNPQSLESVVKGMVESDAWQGLLARAGGQLMHFVEREK